MAKRKRSVVLARPAPAKEPENMFERIHARKKFSILGKKAKGTQRRVGQQRSEGVEKRKGTLLVELQQQRKANTFLDRRFGENDASLTEEDRAVARFQKQRMRDLTGSKFALPDEGAGEPLTHLGQSLAAADAEEGFRLGEEGEEDGAELDAGFVRDFHFGGGFVPKAPGRDSAGDAAGEENGDEPARKRSKKEVMEEVMARSKAHKAARQQQRDADLEATEALDASFGALLQTGSLASLLRAGRGVSRRERRAAEEEAAAGEAAGEAAAPEDAAYDRARRELVFEAKAQAGKRTLTGAELAELEAQRLEALEAERKARLRAAALGGPLGGDDDDYGLGGDDPELGPAPQGAALLPPGLGGVGGFRGRRLRRRLREEAAQRDGRDAKDGGEGASSGGEEGSSGPEEADGSSGEGEEEPPEGLFKLERRQRERAAGAHELQESFRVQSAQLLKKYGVKPTRQSRAELEEAEAGSSGEEGSSREKEEDGEGGEEDSSQEEEEGSEEGEGEPLEAGIVAGEAEEAEEEAGSGLDESKAEEGGSGSEASSEGAASSLEGGGGEKDENEVSSGSEGSSEEASGGSEGSEEEEPEEAGAAPGFLEEREEEDDAQPSRTHKVSAGPPQQSRPGSSVPSAHSTEPSARSAELSARSAAAQRGDPARQLPFVLQLPGSYADFAALVAGRGAGELGEAIARLRACNAAELAANGHRKLQELYGILAQHFALRGGVAPLPLGELDALTAALAELTGVVPLWATTVARARLGRLQERLFASLKEGAPAWPGPRGLLQLRLWTVLFPLGDRRHPVITPLTLLLGAWLGLCPVARPSDIAEGLFLCSLALEVITPGRRFMPEPLTFVTSLLRGALPAAPSQGPQGEEWAVPGGLQHPWLVPEGGWAAVASDAAIQPLSLQQCLSRLGAAPPPPQGDDGGDAARASAAAAEAAWFAGDAFKLGALRAALCVLRQLAGAFAELAPFPEALVPAVAALRDLGGAQLPQALEAQRAEVLACIEAAAATVLATRTPLVRRGAASGAARGKEPRKQFNPRFEEEYQRGKDYDPDRTRAETRKLKRQLQKERRGAMRELRRDAAFLAGAKEAEEGAAKAAQRAQRRANHAFLERQEADMKSGGQGGMFRRRKPKGKR